VGGAALGFLRHNFPPSRIIMGDSGAYFFGFVLAASALLGNLKITTVFVSALPSWPYFSSSFSRSSTPFR